MNINWSLMRQMVARDNLTDQEYDALFAVLSRLQPLDWDDFFRNLANPAYICETSGVTMAYEFNAGHIYQFMRRTNDAMRAAYNAGDVSQTGTLSQLMAALAAASAVYGILPNPDNLDGTDKPPFFLRVDLGLSGDIILNLQTGPPWCDSMRGDKFDSIAWQKVSLHIPPMSAPESVVSDTIDWHRRTVPDVPIGGQAPTGWDWARFKINLALAFVPIPPAGGAALELFSFGLLDPILGNAAQAEVRREAEAARQRELARINDNVVAQFSVEFGLNMQRTVCPNTGVTLTVAFHPVPQRTREAVEQFNRDLQTALAQNPSGVRDAVIGANQALGRTGDTGERWSDGVTITPEYLLADPTFFAEFLQQLNSGNHQINVEGRTW
ncbi:MAG: hypothetical protein FWD83_05975 [Promicromonosporaceae bacterium]|nr:hypothetical protein [Promicromonosporaceae bacterium]